MTIRILMFASLAAKTGKRDASIDLPDGASVGEALRALQAQFPSLREFNGKLAPAVNQAYVPLDYTLSDGDELALIPPVSGG
jgi:molybdopterin synthase catalytic subunit